MKLIRFDSHEDYVKAQTAANQSKLYTTWVTDAELKAIAHYVKTHMPAASFGLCHGVRNGYEVEQLRQLLGFEIIGTEIAASAHQFDHVIQWDFHDVKDEWTGSVDLIYSNSWDHSYDPDMMLKRWMSCLRPEGRCFLHWTPMHSTAGVGGADCFGLSFAELLNWVGRDYRVEHILHTRDYSRLSPFRLMRSVLTTRHLNVRSWKVSTVVLRRQSGI
jgi:hypothetical protein